MATGDRIDPYAAFNFTVEIDGVTTAGFNEVAPEAIPLPRTAAPIVSSLPRTVWRYGEQLVRRVV